MAPRDSFLIAQFSDTHCGDTRFDERLLARVVSEVNDANPDVVVIPGDLTAAGYREQFEEFRRHLERVECPQKIVIAGNHDCRNVGYVLFEEIIGPRYAMAEFPFGLSDGGRPKPRIKIVAVDSNKPDLNDGEVGRDKLKMIAREFADDDCFKVFVLHHHLVSIPGTGRERNIVWDAGDVLEALRAAKVDLVLGGHKHVPYVWPMAGMLLVKSGTASCWRTRGNTQPSYNLIRITDHDITVTTRHSAGDGGSEETHPRRA
jgi:Icc protein